MISENDERDFGRDVLQNICMLDDVITWISRHLDVEDVFDVDTMTDWALDWASDNGYVKEEDENE